MRKLMLMLSLWIVLLVPVSVQAQGKLHFSLVSVDIWPEYDRPAVLMIYHITLAPDTSLACQPVLANTIGCRDQRSGGCGCDREFDQCTI